jgi:hypothetical protein
MATYKDKLERIITALGKTTGLVNMLPGSKAYQLAESIAYEQMQLEYGVERYAQKHSILEATSGDLDNIGNVFFGVPRLTASTPYVTADMKAIKFYVQSGTFGDINYDASGTSRVGKSIELFEGTLVRGMTATGIMVVFRTTQHYVLPANQSEVYVSAELVQGQYDIIQANVLRVHNFTDYSQSSNNLLLVGNPVTIATGRTEESDSSYRFRLASSLKSFPKTTTAGIHETVTNLADVASATIVPSANGGGTFDIFVQGVSPVTSDTVLNNVKAVLTDTVGPWVSYNVLKPYYTGLQISLRVTLIRTVPDPDAIKLQIIENVTRYINNSYASQFYIRNILAVARQASQDIASVDFIFIREHYGAEGARKYTEIDFAKDPNASVFVGTTEKLIVESIKDAITVSI